MWNVLQNEDEHRLLDSAGTKYYALISPKQLHKITTLQPCLQTQWAACAAGVDDVTSCASKQKINKIPAVSSEMSFDGRSLTRPHESPPILCIFLYIETAIIGLHFACNVIDLSSFKFFWWAPQDYFICARMTFQTFKVIQGHWIWRQSKARIRLPIRP